MEKGSSQSIVRKKGRPSKTPKQSSEFKQFLLLLVYLFSPFEWLHGCFCSIQKLKFENKIFINSSKVGIKIIVFH